MAVACGGPPETRADCAGLADPTAREQCRYEMVLPLLDHATALDAAIATVEEPSSRDLLILRLAIAAPDRAGRLCEQVTTEAAREKCRQVLGRPHLQSTPRAPRAQ